MKIRYSKKRLRSNLIVGLIWFTLGFVMWIFYDIVHWNEFFFFAMALLYLGQYMFERQNQYLTITQDEIKVNNLFRKRIKLSDISRIKKFAGDYKIIADEKVIIINTKIIDQESLSELNELLVKLNLPSDKTPFANSAGKSSPGQAARII